MDPSIPRETTNNGSAFYLWARGSLAKQVYAEMSTDNMQVETEMNIYSKKIERKAFRLLKITMLENLLLPFLVLSIFNFGKCDTLPLTLKISCAA